MATVKAKSSRVYLTLTQKEQLQTAYDSGMKNTTGACVESIHQLSAKLKLPIDKIKTWIHTKNSNVRRPSADRYSMPPTKMTSWNVFSKKYLEENADGSFPDRIKKASEKWQQVKTDHTEVSKLEREAKLALERRIEMTEDQKWRQAKRLACKMNKLMEDFIKVDVEVAYIGLCIGKQRLLVGGTTKGVNFITPEFEGEFSSFVNGRETEEKINFLNLRKQVQELFRQKYLSSDCAYPSKYHGTWLYRNVEEEYIMHVNETVAVEILEPINGGISVVEHHACPYRSVEVDDWLYFVYPLDDPGEFTCMKMKHLENALILYDHHLVPEPTGVSVSGNGTRQNCTTTETSGSASIDLVFVIDSSGSICDNNPESCENWRLMLQFVANMVDRLDIGENDTRVGLVRFNGAAENIFYMNKYTDKDSLKAAILNVAYIEGDTNIAAGIRAMSDQQFTIASGDRSNNTDIAVVITDGESTVEMDGTVREALRAHARDIRVIAVGITSNINEGELISISSPPHIKNRNYFLAPNFSLLTLLTDEVIEETCIAAAELAHSCRMNSLDLVFAIDTSVFSLLDITSQNWNSILEFTRTTIAKLTSGTSQRSYHQFGYVTYSASVENVIRLQHSSGLDSGLFEDIFSTLGGFLNEVNTFRNVSGAVRSMDDLFSDDNGGRDYAQDVLVLLTNGSSNVDSNRTVPDAYELRRKGAHIYVIDLQLASAQGGNSLLYNDYEVRYISSSPHLLNDTYWSLTSYDELGQLSDLLSDKFCTSYKHDYEDISSYSCVYEQYGTPVLVFHKYPIDSFLPCTFGEPGTYQMTIDAYHDTHCDQSNRSMATIYNSAIHFDTCDAGWPLQGETLRCIGNLHPWDIGHPEYPDSIQLFYKQDERYGYHYCTKYSISSNGVITLELDTSGEVSETCVHGQFDGGDHHVHTVTLTPVNTEPVSVVVASITPRTGPMAGGTRVTVIGDFGGKKGSVLLEKSGSSPVFMDVISWSANVITAWTGRNYNAEGGLYTVTISLPGGYIHRSDVGFVHAPDPIITNVYPRRTIIQGGVNLTVVGNYFDSVQTAILYIDLELKSPDQQEDDIIVTTFISREVTRVNNTMMIFKTPVIIIPNDYTSVITITRQKRQTPNPEPIVNNEFLEFKAGIEFDGQEKYRNLTSELPTQSRIMVYLNPYFEPFDGVRSFDIETESMIDVKGSDLSLALGMEVYQVSLGRGVCEVHDVLANVLYCRPPTIEPEINRIGDFLKGQPRLIITVGNMRFSLGHVNYTPDIEMLYFLVVLFLAIIGVLFFVFGTVFTNLILRNRRRMKTVSMGNHK